MRKNLATCLAVLLCNLISIAFTIAAPNEVYGSVAAKYIHKYQSIDATASTNLSIFNNEPMTFTGTIRVHEDMPYFIAQLDMRPLPASSLTTLYEYEASITVMYEDGTLIQQITDLEISYGINFGLVEIQPENPANFHFADYNNDGFQDMALRKSIGSSLTSDPHYFWLWNTELEQFERNYELEALSRSSSISLAYDGNVRTFLRHTLGHYVQETHKYLDGNLIPYITRERKPSSSWGMPVYKTIITDHINNTQSIVLEPS